MNHTVSIPAGSTADDWQPEQYRTVYGPRRTVPGREEFGVTATAAQLRDGSIDNGTIIEAPQVYLNAPERGLTAAQARSLAGLLLDAAQQLDSWAGTTQSSWRAMADRLTPEQVRHLAAVERLALDSTDNPAMRDTAGDTLYRLPDEARAYAEANPRPGEQSAADMLRQTRSDLAGYRVAAVCLLFTSRDDITTHDDALARVDRMVNPTS